MNEQICKHCGPKCLRGAGHNARAEDGVIYEAPATDCQRGYHQPNNELTCTVCGARWYSIKAPHRGDIIGVRVINDSSDLEYLMHNNALCNPSYTATAA